MDVSKLIGLDVLNNILKKVYSRITGETDEKIDFVSSSLNTAITDITTNTNNIDNLTQSVSSLQSGLESAQSNISALQNKTYEYLTNEEIDTVFA